MNTKRVLAAVALGAIFTSISAGARPDIGDASPQFKAMDQNTNYIRLADYRGKKNVLLFFYPQDFTTNSTAEACGLRDRMRALSQHNVVVIGVSFDSDESHLKFATQNGLKFSLIADPEGKIAYAFGAKMKGTNEDSQVSFLIDTDGNVVQVVESNVAADHFQAMETAIAGLN